MTDAALVEEQRAPFVCRGKERLRLVRTTTVTRNVIDAALAEQSSQLIAADHRTESVTLDRDVPVRRFARGLLTSLTIV